MNSFGEIFRITTFGESHGEALGVVIDGCLPNIDFNFDFVQSELNRRKPGQSNISTSRNEDETFEVLSGIFNGKTTGSPLTLLVRNINQKSEDYDKLKDVFRPGHADYTYQQKYGIRDHRGGGRQSARETVARVLAGAVAKMYLQSIGISIHAYVSQVYNIKLEKDYTQLDLKQIESNVVRCPDSEKAKEMIALIEQTRAEGDSLGGIVSCVCKGMPVGLGEPVFDKLHAQLGKAILSINACKGFEIGSGFDAVTMKGSEHNDAFELTESKEINTKTNHSGGVLGGISNGMDLFFKAAFKPVSSIRKEQQTIDTNYNSIDVNIDGRHDPCIVPRAVPIVEAMAALVLIDMLLRNKMYR